VARYNGSVGAGHVQKIQKASQTRAAASLAVYLPDPRLARFDRGSPDDRDPANGGVSCGIDLTIRF
jgi:hypothetical protein